MKTSKFLTRTVVTTSLSCILFQAAFASLPPAWEESEWLSCEYAGKFEQCMQANRNGSTRSIKDFVCIQSADSQAVLDQIILDVTFQEIDEEIMEYLVALEEDKEFAATETNRAIDDVTKNFWKEGDYYKRYKKLCNGWILAERAKCTWSVPIIPVGDRIKGSDNSRECMNLVNNKLDIYMNVADNVLKLNKSEFLQDAHKEYVQQEREKYDELLTTMMNIIGHAGRLARGMTHWTPNPLQAMLLRHVHWQIIKLV